MTHFHIYFSHCPFEKCKTRNRWSFVYKSDDNVEKCVKFVQWMRIVFHQLSLFRGGNQQKSKQNHSDFLVVQYLLNRSDVNLNALALSECEKKRKTWNLFAFLLEKNHLRLPKSWNCIPFALSVFYNLLECAHKMRSMDKREENAKKTVADHWIMICGWQTCRHSAYKLS